CARGGYYDYDDWFAYW
nr:immunoglobulin heavy chain junction region [Mus musculus]